MKKIIQMNIGRMVFSIDEDAYGVLNKYLIDIKDHFSLDSEGDEIVEDIESSIAEKLSKKAKNLNIPVGQQEVKKVISELGSIAEISESNEEYSKKDPQKDNISNSEKPPLRLYKSTEDVVIGGVASGIASYFNIDPIITRVLFVASLFMNGFGALAYLVLWIAMPKAKTPSQKLAMKGEKANLESITNFIKSKAPDQSTQSIIKKIMVFPVLVIGFLFDILKKIFPVLRGLFGVVLFFSSIFLLFLFSAIFFAIIGGVEVEMDNTTAQLLKEFAEGKDILFPLIGVYISLIIPTIFALLGSAYLIFQKKMLNMGLAIILFFTWIFALSYSSVNIATHSKEIEQLVYSIDENIKENPDEDFYIYIAGENILDERVIDEDMISFGDDPLLIGGDAVPNPIIPGKKEFSIIGDATQLSPETITVQENDAVTVRFKSNEGVMKITISEFDMQAASRGGTVTSVFTADKKGIFIIYGQVQGDDKKKMGRLIVE